MEILSDSWNKSSSLQEVNLAEIISEELRNRLVIENDFVWVDVPEKEIVNGLVESAKASNTLPKTKDESCNSSNENIANIVQYEVDTEKQSKDIIETDEECERDYWEQFENVEAKPINTAKLKYSMPQFLKRREHDVIRIHSNNKNKNYKPENELLPRIKFNAFTTAVLEKLISNRYLGKYEHVIGTGKSSIVIYAVCHRNNCITMPCFNAVKVYKISSNVEKNKLVFKRVQREFEHLNLLHKHMNIHNQNIPCPVRARENVIVMGFVGCDHNTACPTIKDIEFEDDRGVYYAIIDFIDKCYNQIHLVHGKLSAKKILWSGMPWFIGWSHSVKTDHPLALSKLIKDCKFVTEFFEKRGVAVMSTEDLFKKITDQNKINGKLLELINASNLYDQYNTNPNRNQSPVKVNKYLRFK